MKETLVKNCAECSEDFQQGETVFYTWYENATFCNKCKQVMNRRVTESYLEWQIRNVVIPN